ncbi:hypothetical protein OG762_01480 [Streptomyces sp. NBC_01136]|uniref:hypothetical protein n=1 Tax=unclassified Streptomyces TaxID=2593676 RepID=UPI0032536FD3|nr:hypothetical protein OG762_01480 [Streptomyces sp. NBC_01136]
MLLAQTGDGLARVGPDALQLLDAPGRSLEDFIVAGRLAEVRGLRIRKEISRKHATIALRYGVPARSSSSASTTGTTRPRRTAPCPPVPAST